MTVYQVSPLLTLSKTPSPTSLVPSCTSQEKSGCAVAMTLKGQWLERAKVVSFCSHYTTRVGSWRLTSTTSSCTQMGLTVQGFSRSAGAQDKGNVVHRPLKASARISLAKASHGAWAPSRDILHCLERGLELSVPSTEAHTPLDEQRCAFLSSMSRVQWLWTSHTCLSAFISVL